MSVPGHSRLRGPAAAGALFVCLASLSFAQTNEAESDTEDDGQPMDEIVVTADKPGDSRMETPYEEVLRQRVIDEYNRIAREQEELAWRQDPDISDPSRISFGYRPQDRSRDDTGNRFNTLPMDQVKPATVFRFEF